MKNLLKKIVIMILAVFTILVSNTSIDIYAMNADEVVTDGTYHLVDFATGEDLGSYQAFLYAHQAMKNNKANYYNLGIVKDGVVYEAEHAIVVFNSSDACDVNISYINVTDSTEGYTNACYGKDGAYISTNDSGTRIRFMLSGVEAWGSFDDMTIVPVESLTTTITSYIVDEGTLYHLIKTEMEDDNYASIISNGDAPSYLEEGQSYYSYDGHYFYHAEDISIMLEDYYNGVRDGSVNPDDPYYNYYQFVSHRTLTNVSASEAEDYIENTMGIKGFMQSYSDRDLDSSDDTLTRSQLYKSTDAFWMYQYEYGANALMMLALSYNETYYGHSSLSYTRNNLFGHAAYDSDVEANASRYLSIDHSIYSHAKYYISGSYASPLKSQFHGSFFGNKASGMNVSYASDPYWGEKAASYYEMIDTAFGSKDKNSYTLGIKTSTDSFYIYQYPENGSKVLYDSGESSDMAFVILGEIYAEDGTEWYKVQCEATLNEDSAVDLSYDYDYENTVGYILAEDIQVIIDKKEDTGETSYVHVTFEANGGTFPGELSSITYAIPVGSVASAVAPTKDNALFVGWDKELTELTEDTTYTAVYKDVTSIEMSSYPKQEYEVNDRINLTGGTITVTYADGTQEDVDLTTSMVSGFSFETDSEQEVTVTYGGCTTSYMITVSAEKDNTRTEIKDSIVSVIERYASTEELSDWDINYLLTLKQTIDDNVLPYLTHYQLRTFDSIIRKAIGSSIRYVIEKNNYNLGVSGLSVSVPLVNSLNKPELLADTYRVRIKQGISTVASDAMQVISDFWGTDVKDTFTITMRKNFSSFSLDGPVLFTINKPADATEGEVYTVLYYNEETDDVVECYTRQTSNTVTFMGTKDGEYMLVSQRTANTYTGDDPIESVTASTQSFDMEYVFVGVTVGLVVAIILGTLIHKLWKKRHDKKVVIKREVKNEEKAKEPLPPVDVTQALEVFDTEVLDLDKIRELDEEHQRRIHKNDK